MKKILLVVAVLVLAAAIFGTGFAFAQYQNVAAQGSTPFGMGRGGQGLLRDYMEKALAEKLGITEADVETALAGGTTMHQLALDSGIAEADIVTFMNDVHKTALEKAVADGVITQEQADFMLERMATRLANGDCTGTSRGFGPGMMKGGRGSHGMMGGWQNQSNP